METALEELETTLLEKYGSVVKRFRRLHHNLDAEVLISSELVRENVEQQFDLKELEETISLHGFDVKEMNFYNRADLVGREKKRKMECLPPDVAKTQVEIEDEPVVSLSVSYTYPDN